VNLQLDEIVVDDPHRVLDPKLSDAVGAGGPKEAIPQLLTDALQATATECGSRVAVISATKRFSYAEIELYSNRLAARLMANGIRPGDRVIIGLPNSLEFIVACFAIWKTRAVVVAIDSCTRAANLPVLLDRVEPAALIAERKFAETLLETTAAKSLRAFFLNDHTGCRVAPGHIIVESLQAAMRDGRPVTIPARGKPDDLATITLTSGSTNVPKGVMHTHESILACASFTQSYLKLSQDDVVMLPIPLHHVLAFRRFLTCFLARCTLVLAPDIFIMKSFSETHPTGLVLVPSACNFLADNFGTFLRKEGSCLRYLEIGGEPISSERLQTLQAILSDTQIHLTYGLTEGRVGYLKSGPNGVFDRLDRWNHGLEISVVDGEGRRLKAGKEGEILISGSGLFKGYWRDAAATQAALSEDGFRTGDVGVTDASGTIQLMGRIDDMIKVAGHKVHPREIEVVLQRHPSVQEVVVAQCRDQSGMKSAIRAHVVLRKDIAVSDAELLAHCREHLELYKVPASICFRDSFPKTALGKIQRHLVV